MHKSHSHSYHRVLSLDPSRKGFGYIVLESGLRLVDWGVAQVYSNSEEGVLVRVESIVDRYRPVLIVVEDIEDSKQRRRAVDRIEFVRKYARQRGIVVDAVSRAMVRRAFKETGGSKHGIATAITREFPELEQRLPPVRKPWMSEDERMSIFDAFSFALSSVMVKQLNIQAA